MVNTAFVEVLDDGQLARTKRFIPIPVSEISLFSLGTVWQNGICILERILEERTYELDYSPDGWDFTSFRERYPGEPYPHELYPHYNKDKNWMLEFYLQKGGTLVVPCQEFFSRCYGFSGEIKRVLTTYPWDECLVRFFGDNRGKTTGPVTVRHNVKERDILMLEYARRHPDSCNALKGIYTHLITEFRSQDPHNPVPAFIRIAPWHRQKALLRVQGLAFGENGRSFLGLRITGVSDPDGPSVEYLRLNSGSAENPAPEGSPSAWGGAGKTLQIKVPDSVTVTGQADPEPGVQKAEAETPGIERLGKPRTMHSLKPFQAQYSSGKQSPGQNTDTFASGMPQQSGLAVGELSTMAGGDNVLDSEGTVRDVWNALILLKTTQPELVNSLEWYCPTRGFVANDSPAFVAFEPGISAHLRLHNWCYIDTVSGKRRGVLFLRISTPDVTACIAEIERRPPKSDELMTREDEAFKGVIVICEPGFDPDGWLRTYLESARLNEGRVGNFVATLPGRVFSFKHSTSKNMHHPGIPAVKNALSKVGITAFRNGSCTVETEI